MSDEEGALDIPKLSPLMGGAERKRLLSPGQSPKFSLHGTGEEKNSQLLEEVTSDSKLYSPLMSSKERERFFSSASSFFQASNEDILPQHSGDAEESRKIIVSPSISASNSNLSEHDEKEPTPRESLRSRLRKMNASKKRSGSLSKGSSPDKQNSKLDPEMMTLDEEYEVDQPPPNSLKRLRRAGGLRARSKRRLRRSMSESNLALRLRVRPNSSAEPEKRLNSKLFGKIAQLKSRIKEIETRREAETDVLNQHIESLTRARGEHKNTIDLLMKEVSLGLDEEAGILSKPLRANSARFTIDGNGGLDDEVVLRSDSALLKKDKGQNFAELELKKLQDKLDNANSQVDHLSKKLSHHRKESQMLYNQINSKEESKVNMEHMESKIAELQEKNSTLEKSIQGEVMLMNAIETLKKQVEETRDTNSLLQRQLDEQASSHSDVIKNMKEKLKDKVELEQRLRLLEDQLGQYTKQMTPWSETHIEARTSTLNVKPYPNMAIQSSTELDRERGLELLGTITPPHVTDVEIPDSVKKLRKQNKQNETLIKRLAANLAEESAFDEVDERNAQIISNDFKSVLTSQLVDKKTVFNRSNSVPLRSPEKQRRKSQDTDAAVLAVLTRIEVLARIEDLMTVEIERIREEMRAKTETLENKNKEVAELQRKLEAAEALKDGKVEDLEELIRQREISLSELQKKSDHEIQNLRKELSAKDDTFIEERKLLEDELKTLREKSSKFEQQFKELEKDSRQVRALQEKVAQLEKELDISREEASVASASKVQVIQLLAAEMERLKDNYGGFVTIRKNVRPASGPRSKEGAGIAHYTARI